MVGGNRESVDSVKNHLAACYRVADRFDHSDLTADYIASRHPAKSMESFGTKYNQEIW